MSDSGPGTGEGRGAAGGRVGALDGVRVLDASTLLAAPQISALLGDLGADVVQLEPPVGDPLRHMGVQRAGRSLMWAMVGRNKRSITLDLARDEARPAFEGLVRWADVFVENYPPAVAARRRCTYQDLAAVNPGIVVASVSCYGRTGPYADRPGAGTIAEAFAGLTHMTGEPDGPPILASLPLGDGLTAMAGALGVIAALYHRDCGAGSGGAGGDGAGSGGGRGQHVDISMFEPILHLMNGTIAGYDGEGPSPRRTGSRVPGGVPRNTYRCADGSWVAVAGTTDNQVQRLLPLLGLDDPGALERYGRSAARLAVADELDGLVATWVAGLTRAEVVEALLAAGIPVAPVNDVADLLRDPHVRSRGSVVTVEDPDLGSVRLVPATPRLVSTPASVRTTGPDLGADTDAVLVGLAGLDPAQVAQLRAAGVV